MKRIFRVIVPGLLLCSVGSTALGQGRIATIDLRKVFESYWKTKQADSQLKDRATDMEKEHTNMVDDFKKAKADYNSLLNEANNQAYSAEERDKRKKSAEDKLKYIKDQEDVILQYERQARTTLEDQNRRMHDKIVGEIRDVINAKAKASGFGLVLDSSAQSASSAPVVLFNSLENDITDTVLSQLNATAPPEAPKAEEKSDKSDKSDAKKKSRSSNQ